MSLAAAAARQRHFLIKAEGGNIRCSLYAYLFCYDIVIVIISGALVATAPLSQRLRSIRITSCCSGSAENTCT